ncbi:metal-dependent transcriptional regulator [uncultured Ruminococcus sp.]|uniref:metal-dependent transcriptional regulator n=1 Tax=uncultured Ruminococcus sp. TaxID=165186 RepID=UPI000EE9E7AE|nr:metal-dependent transcriptional regulator [uncultured Ruminococcus sp.]HCJ42203.1 metal-dependent transcriptional regulator [Ruminococcus sp.]
MLTKSQKKYLFAIYLLGQDGGSVKSTSVSDFLNVSKASTVKMTQKLIEEAYIIKEPYREIRLTQKGIREANKLFTPSVILQNFLTSTVGVSAEKAREASVVIASELDEETLEKLVAYSLSLAK